MHASGRRGMTALRWSRCIAGFSVLVLLGVVSCAKIAPRPGDVCGGDELGVASCPEPDRMLSCRSFAWRLEPCRGPHGCTPRGQDVASCDRSVGEEGDPCEDRDEVRCAADRGRLLRCEGSVMVVAEHCHGKRGCYRGERDGAPTCDRGGVEAGDLCEREGTRCSSDGKSVLRCAVSRRYELERSCRGPKGCYPSPILGAGFLLCDVSVGDVGEACGSIPEGGLSCSSDGLQENACRGGTLVGSAPCPAGCVAQWGDDGRTYRIACRQ
jgi:hypothetical protein